MKIILIHNPLCSKSNETLRILKEKKADFKIRNYLKDPLNREEISDLIKKGINLDELIRDNPAINKGILNDEEKISLIVRHPSILQRPILVSKNSALICRPPSLAYDFLQSIR